MKFLLMTFFGPLDADKLNISKPHSVNLRHQAVFRLQAHLTNSTSINSPTLFSQRSFRHH